MKYIINQKQYRLILESLPSWLKRRLHKENLTPYVERQLSHTLAKCDSFIDQHDFAKYVINWAVDDFIFEDERDFENYDVDEIMEKLREICNEWFYEELTDKWLEKCSN